MVLRLGTQVRLCHVGRLLAGQYVRPVDPAPEVDQPATFGAEGKARQVGHGGDGVGTRTEGAASLDHQVAPFPFEAVLDAGGDEDEDEVVVAGAASFDAELAGLSASARFLYDSLR